MFDRNDGLKLFLSGKSLILGGGRRIRLRTFVNHSCLNRVCAIILVMRSRFADKFNHDEDAAGYDQEVLDESHPHRAGYSAALDWVSNKTKVTEDSVVLDLGCGTGNLALRLGAFKQLVGVDISEKMLAIAREKLAHLDGVEFIEDDLLGYFDRDMPEFDAVVSTYSIHHLTEEEKSLLFQKIYGAVKPGGAAVFGDLMFADKKSREEMFQEYSNQDRTDLIEDIEDEFFWDVDTAVAELQKLGFKTEIERFSELSWGIAAVKM